MNNSITWDWLPKAKKQKSKTKETQKSQLQNSVRRCLTAGLVTWLSHCERRRRSLLSSEKSHHGHQQRRGLQVRASRIQIQTNKKKSIKEKKLQIKQNTHQSPPNYFTWIFVESKLNLWSTCYHLPPIAAFYHFWVFMKSRMRYILHFN